MKTEEMCASCVHNGYCPGAYKKDHWCSNRTNREAVKVDYSRQQHGSIGMSEGKNRQ